MQNFYLLWQNLTDSAASIFQVYHCAIYSTSFGILTECMETKHGDNINCVFCLVWCLVLHVTPLLSWELPLNPEAGTDLFLIFSIVVKAQKPKNRNLEVNVEMAYSFSLSKLNLKMTYKGPER